MGLRPKQSIYVTLGNQIRFGSIYLAGTEYSDYIYEFNSVLFRIPFTTYAFMWYDKRYRGGGRPASETYRRGLVEEIRRNTNLFPVMHECAGDDNRFTVKALVTDEDWNAAPDGVSWGGFKSITNRSASTFEHVWHLYSTYGITDYWSTPDDGESYTVHVGFSPRNNKWYGWSHRAIRGFTIGDKFPECSYFDPKSGDCDIRGNCSKYAKNQCVKDVISKDGIILTMNQARLAAEVFADPVA